MGHLIDKVSGRKGDRDSEEDEEETNQPVDLPKVTDMSNAARAKAQSKGRRKEVFGVGCRVKKGAK